MSLIFIKSHNINLLAYGTYTFYLLVSILISIDESMSFKIVNPYIQIICYMINKK